MSWFFLCVILWIVLILLNFLYCLCFLKYAISVVYGMILELTHLTNIVILSEPRHDKTNKMTVRPAKTQISLGIHPVWSESSLSAWRTFGSLATHWALSQDFDQTGWMSRLIWVFAGRTVTLLVLSCCGSSIGSLWKDTDETARICRMICAFVFFLYSMTAYFSLVSVTRTLANSVNSDPMSQNVSSYQGQHCSH